MIYSMFYFFSCCCLSNAILVFRIWYSLCSGHHCMAPCFNPENCQLQCPLIHLDRLAWPVDVYTQQDYSIVAPTWWEHYPKKKRGPFLCVASFQTCHHACDHTLGPPAIWVPVHKRHLSWKHTHWSHATREALSCILYVYTCLVVATKQVFSQGVS